VAKGDEWPDAESSSSLAAWANNGFLAMSLTKLNRRSGVPFLSDSLRDLLAAISIKRDVGESGSATRRLGPFRSASSSGSVKNEGAGVRPSDVLLTLVVVTPGMSFEGLVVMVTGTVCVFSALEAANVSTDRSIEGSVQRKWKNNQVVHTRW